MNGRWRFEGFNQRGDIVADVCHQRIGYPCDKRHQSVSNRLQPVAANVAIQPKAQIIEETQKLLCEIRDGQGMLLHTVGKRGSVGSRGHGVK